MLDLFGEEIEEKKKDANVFSCIAASNHAKGGREIADFYATEPRAVQELLERETFTKTILEPCVGKGHIAEVLTRGGVQLYS